MSSSHHHLLLHSQFLKSCCGSERSSSSSASLFHVHPPNNNDTDEEDAHLCLKRSLLLFSVSSGNDSLIFRFFLISSLFHSFNSDFRNTSLLLAFSAHPLKHVILVDAQLSLIFVTSGDHLKRTSRRSDLIFFLCLSFCHSNKDSKTLHF